MFLYFVIIPPQAVAEKVWELRQLAVRNHFASLDPRHDTLPHITVGYLGDVDSLAVKRLITALSGFSPPPAPTLQISGFTQWNDNIVSLFDASKLAGLVADLQSLAGSVGIQSNFEYVGKFGPVGDHMKIIREVPQSSGSQVIALVEPEFPSTITFHRLALIDHGCTGRDVLWQTPFLPAGV